MPFQPMDLSAFANYLQQQQQQNKPPDLMEQFKAGFGASQYPAQMARKREEEELANALQKIKLEQAQNPVASIDDILKRKKLEAETSKLNAETNNLTNPKADPLAEFKSQLLQLQVQKAQSDVDNAQTPEQKQQALMDLETHKSNLRQQEEASKPKDEVTQGAKTKFQEQIKNIDLFIPLLEKISEIPLPKTPNEYAAYKSKVDKASEKFLSSSNLPRILESLQMSKDVVSRHWYETPEHFQQRIKDLIQETWGERDILEGKNLPKRPEEKSKSGTKKITMDELNKL